MSVGVLLKKENLNIEGVPSAVAVLDEFLSFGFSRGQGCFDLFDVCEICYSHVCGVWVLGDDFSDRAFGYPEGCRGCVVELQNVWEIFLCRAFGCPEGWRGCVIVTKKIVKYLLKK